VVLVFVNRIFGKKAASSVVKILGGGVYHQAVMTLTPARPRVDDRSKPAMSRQEGARSFRRVKERAEVYVLPAVREPV
jgi:hypothetical protein